MKRYLLLLFLLPVIAFAQTYTTDPVRIDKDTAIVRLPYLKVTSIMIGGTVSGTESDPIYIADTGDIIHFTDSGNFILTGNITVDGDTSKFTSERFVIEAPEIIYRDTMWRDVTVSATTLAPGAQAPSLRTFISPIQMYAYNYQTANDAQWGQAQFNHDYMLGQPIRAHMHYALESAPESTDTTVWRLIYSWADINETFPAIDTLTIEIPLAGKTALKHYVVGFGDINGSGGDNVSSSIVFEISRLNNDPSDTYQDTGEWVFLLDVDFHVPINSPGSKFEYIK